VSDPDGFRLLSERRAARARSLAGRHPASREALEFYAELATFQGHVVAQAACCQPGRWDELVSLRGALVDVVCEHGPAPLVAAAAELTDTTCRDAIGAYREGRDTTSLQSFFARVLLQPHAATQPGATVDRDDGYCPACGQLPQVGVLRPEGGHGSALSLACSLCFHEWAFRRGCCAACGESSDASLAFYSAEGFDHVQVQTCETCRHYLHTVDLGRDVEAIPDVDEVAALPLDVWAREQGFAKRQLNLVGM
jgi:FdhE protein